MPVNSRFEFLSRLYFKFFYNHIFSISLLKKENKFYRGEHIDDISDRIQNNYKTGTKSARKHSKSHIFYAYVMWKIWLMWKGWLNRDDLEIYYGSYTAEYARKHIKRIRRYIEINPYFAGIPMNIDAETLIKIVGKRDDGLRIYNIDVLPMGILSFKRGEHPDVIILDDILRDERRKGKIDVAMITKITDIFKEEILSMPKEKTGELHISGTPQDKADIFSFLCKSKAFNFKEYKAIIDVKKKIPLWPEMYTYDRLMIIKFDELGQKAFNKEYMCSPERSEEGYIKDEEYNEVVNNQLPNLLDWLDKNEEDRIRKFIDKLDGQVFGGHDIGKKRHPSHLCLYLKEEYELKEGDEVRRVVYKYTELGQKWMDNWSYHKQINYLNKVARVFGLEVGGFDNTRGEFEAFTESNELDGAWKPIVFGSKNQNEYAGELDKLINYQDGECGQYDFQPIEILEDGRQQRQLTNVDNDLKAVDTEEGHGDSFWSHILMLMVAQEGSPSLRRAS